MGQSHKHKVEKQGRRGESEGRNETNSAYYIIPFTVLSLR